jgi:arylsulfatase
VSACATPDAPKGPAAAPGARTDFGRGVLPVADPSYPPSTELDASKATPPPRFEVNAPAQAPNVIVVLLDDFGFGQSSTFGGAIQMPTLDRLAAGGLRYTNFHVAALCSPTGSATTGSPALSGRSWSR